MGAAPWLKAGRVIPDGADGHRCADTVQSTGAYKPQELVPEAIKVIQGKIDAVEAGLTALYPSHAPGYQHAE